MAFQCGLFQLSFSSGVPVYPASIRWVAQWYPSVHWVNQWYSNGIPVYTGPASVHWLRIREVFGTLQNYVAFAFRLWRKYRFSLSAQTLNLPCLCMHTRQYHTLHTNWLIVVARGKSASHVMFISQKIRLKGIFTQRNCTIVFINVARSNGVCCGLVMHSYVNCSVFVQVIAQMSADS